MVTLGQYSSLSRINDFSIRHFLHKRFSQKSHNCTWFLTKVVLIMKNGKSLEKHVMNTGGCRKASNIHRLSLSKNTLVYFVKKSGPWWKQWVYPILPNYSATHSEEFFGLTIIISVYSGRITLTNTSSKFKSFAFVCLRVWGIYNKPRLPFPFWNQRRSACS